MQPVTIGVAVGDEAVVLAAGIWSRAKARRDGSSTPDGADSAVPGVRRRLALDGSTLLLAGRGSEAVGFAVCAPREVTLELFYLAVDPDAWGDGVGALLLASVDDLARVCGRDALELWVIDDNARAIAVYERAGWEPTGELVRDDTSGKLERRFVRCRS